ncbi:MAG TPA: globin domain-containing protein [Pseudonocardia sp.]
MNADGARSTGTLTEAPAWPPEPEELARLAGLVRASFAEIAPRLDAVISRFYAVLCTSAPGVREMFPINMESQRDRFARVLIYLVGALERPRELTEFLSQLGRDHRKFDVTEEQFPLFGQALLSALAGAAGDGWTPEVADAWSRVYTYAADTMIAAARADTGPAAWHGEVVEHERLDSDVALVRVRTDPSLRCRPGQYLSVEVPQRPRTWRSYTPTAAEQPDGVLELMVKAVGYAGVSRAIVSATRPGDVWRLGPPLGRLPGRIDPARNLVMIGGGTGVTPVQALLRGMETTAEHTGVTPAGVTVYYGARRWEELHALDALRIASFRNRWLDVLPVVREQPDEAGPEVGTLADVVVRHGRTEGADVVVSGSPAMIRATVRALLSVGVGLGRIHYDPFVDD